MEQRKTVPGKGNNSMTKAKSSKTARCGSGLQHRVLGNGTRMVGRVELGIKHPQPKVFEFVYAGFSSDMWRVMFCLDVEVEA